MMRFLGSLLAIAIFLAIGGQVSADIVVGFEGNSFPLGQDHQYSAPLSGIALETTNAFGPIYGVSSKSTASSPNFSSAYWANGDDTVVSTGGAGGSNNWFMAFNGKQGDVVFTAPTGNLITSVQINNTALVDYTVRNGLNGYSRKLDQPGDFFKVMFVGFNESLQPTTTTAMYDLVTFTDSLYVLSDWTTIDLRSLNSARVGLKFFSTDMGTPSVFDDGILTPTYLALDNFTITAVPEPSSFGLLVLSAIGCLVRRRRG